MSFESGLEEKHVEKQWQSFEAVQGPDSLLQRSTSLNILVRCVGLPRSRRGAMWLKWSGADKLKHAADKTYDEYVSLAQSTEDPFYATAKAQIELDLLRTWPQDPRFKPGMPAIDQLRRILVALCVRNAAQGYLQSQNFVVCFLLVSTGFDEEMTFWLMCSLVEVLMPTFYVKDMHGIKALVEDFGRAIEKKMPKVAARMEAMHTSATFRSFAWFLTLFFGTLKPRVLVRIWDVFFYAAIEHQKDDDFDTSSSSSSASMSSSGKISGNDGREMLCVQHCRCEAVLISTALGLLAINEAVLMNTQDALQMATAIQDISDAVDCKEQEQKLIKFAFGGTFGTIENIALGCSASVACREQLYRTRLHRLRNLSRVATMPSFSMGKHRRGSSHRQILDMQSEAFNVPGSNMQTRAPRHRRARTTRFKLDAEAAKTLVASSFQENLIPEDSNDILSVPHTKRVKQEGGKVHVSVVQRKNNRFDSNDFAFPASTQARVSVPASYDDSPATDPLTPVLRQRAASVTNARLPRSSSSSSSSSPLPSSLSLPLAKGTPELTKQKLRRKPLQAKSLPRPKKNKPNTLGQSTERFLDALLSPGASARRKQRAAHMNRELLPMSSPHVQNYIG